MKRVSWVSWSCLIVTVLFSAPPGVAQFTAEELAQREEMEEFLRKAEIVGSEQLPKSEGVLQPHKLTLRGADGTERQALWKDAEGRKGGFVEGWKYEVAAYHLDKHFGVNSVPATAEREYDGRLGSIQLWVNAWMSGREKLDLKKKKDPKADVPASNLDAWNKATYLQRAFDDLIGNEDRHMGNILILDDWRVILIDHSRSFRTTKAFTKKLPNDDKPIKQVPRGFFQKLKELDRAKLVAAAGRSEAAGDYLDDKEIDAVMTRRDLLVEKIEAEIDKRSEFAVLYGK